MPHRDFTGPDQMSERTAGSRQLLLFGRSDMMEMPEAKAKKASPAICALPVPSHLRGGVIFCRRFAAGVTEINLAASFRRTPALFDQLGRSHRVRGARSRTRTALSRGRMRTSQPALH